ncbi:PREDICTED: beta-fructofuranosidase, soluble isoenzyme I-like [Nelumbo nucifera]|uniref:Beta-fructofuranosidase, soluble isoenzyme I-like n=1 Tax=Nelumbo nucifera TaxID=4432 RepID=A0A1U8ABV2_NELNU|nr:PREDICTED: beta-fructofuranosidase, soluble isoenzyme I-like [Nelumbo nucifera]
MYTDPFRICPDLERAVSYPYNPLHNEVEQEGTPVPGRRPIKVISSILLSGIFVLALVMVFLCVQRSQEPLTDVMERNHHHSLPSSTPVGVSRGVLEGVSEKTFRLYSNKGGVTYPWTQPMLSWQRTAYHFQPEKNWMNDPNAPMYYNGWYHLFYQYNPESAVWGNITWGHAISKDLINWENLPFAMVPDEWYDINGVWTGSATLLPDGSIVVLYTGFTKDKVQVQNLAYPADPSDPRLIHWVKYPGNPILVPPPHIRDLDFRDPTTAWFGPDGHWRVAIGSKINDTGISLVYHTTNFTTYELLDGLLHAVPETGMWECVDFYPVSTTEKKGLNTSDNWPGVKHVLKASLDNTKIDYYALGTYYVENDTWIPDNEMADVGFGLRYDYGKYYASKTFYDQNKQRRVLWGWIGESDSEDDDIKKGWASVQSIPRVVLFDQKTRSNLLQWPVEEVENLRSNLKEFNKVVVGPGTVVPLDVGTATQLDISAEFEIDGKALKGATRDDIVGYNCVVGGGANYL